MTAEASAIGAAASSISASAGTAVDTAATACQHCGLPLRAGQVRFCCAGCRGAQALIAGAGLQAFYALRDDALRDEAPRTAELPDLAAAELSEQACALPEFSTAHSVLLHSGERAIAWYVEGLHCAACVWLLERLPALLPGVRTARVGFSAGTLHTVYDPARCDPGRIAGAVTRLGYRVAPAGEGAAILRRETRDLLARCAVAGVAAVGSMHLAVQLSAGELSGDLAIEGARWFGLVALATALPALVWSAAPIWRGAWRSLRAGRVNVDAAAAGAVVVGFAASLIGAWSGSTTTYADALALFVALLLLGRLLVLIARARTQRQGDALPGLLPATALRVRPGTVRGDAQPEQAESTELIAVLRLRPGDRVRVASAGVVPCDGVLISDRASIDTAVLTGEPRPQELHADDRVLAGTRNRGAAIDVAVQSTGTATRVGGLLAGVRAAGHQQTPITAAADRMQAWLLPATLLLAFAVGLGWAVAAGPAVGASIAVAMILVACPCALGLATPLVQAAALAAGSRQGLLIRAPAALDVLAGSRAGPALRTAVLDKTGTLTLGRQSVVTWTWLDAMTQSDGTEREELRDAQQALLAAAVARSAHPVAFAIAEHLRPLVPEPQREAAAATLSAWREEPGAGLLCATPLGELRLGNQTWTGLALAGDAQVGVVAATLGGQALARMALADPLRPSAAALVELLRARGLSVHLCTGDDAGRALAVAASLGIAPDNVHAACAPEAKRALVERLRREGPVLYCGDGANDAPACTAADVAIGLSGGIAAALPAVHIFAAREDGAAAVLDLLHLADAAHARLRLILAISLAYNALGLVAAAVGIFGPLVCAIAMPLSSLTVIALAGTVREIRGRNP